MPWKIDKLKERLGLKLLEIGARLYFGDPEDKVNYFRKCRRYKDAFNGELLEAAVVYAGGHGFNENKIASTHWHAELVPRVLKNASHSLDTDRELNKWESDGYIGEDR